MPNIFLGFAGDARVRKTTSLLLASLYKELEGVQSNRDPEQVPAKRWVAERQPNFRGILEVTLLFFVFKPVVRRFT